MFDFNSKMSIHLYILYNIVKFESKIYHTFRTMSNKFSRDYKLVALKTKNIAKGKGRATCGEQVGCQFWYVYILLFLLFCLNG